MITGQKILIFDGAMGTMLQKKGLSVGALPELYNITNPELICAIHKEYAGAGADVISTNTFQANALKIPKEYSVEEIVHRGVRLAKESSCKYVALDVGPLGQLIEPMGTLTFNEAYELFKQQMVQGEKSGADCIILETFSSLYEMKIAILAAKENTKLPVICSMTYQENGRTFVGTDPVTATLTIQSLGADAVGLNCSVGPNELKDVVDKILRYAQIPVIVQANAGLPSLVDGESHYNTTAEDYCKSVMSFVEKGVRIVGGCCGTDPEFIRQLHLLTRNIKPHVPFPRPVTAATSETQHRIFDGDITVIGERLNPTGKKRLQAALRGGENDYIITEAIVQYENGSDILDVNVGLPDIDEVQKLSEIVKEIQSIVPVPLQIDSTDHKAIENAVRIYNGRPIINSVNGKQSSMDRIFPIAKKYGALVIGLLLDENGIPDTAEKRFKVARKIIENAARHGIYKEDIILDCLVLTASAQQSQVLVALETVKLVKREFGVKTILGVSNVSFGLPAREILNTTFLAAAFGAGTDAAIVNSLSEANMKVVDAFRVLNATDVEAEKFIQKYKTEATISPTKQVFGDELDQIIIQGRKNESAFRVRALLESGMKPIEIIDKYFIPSLNYVGDGFANGSLFLPQLMQSAETVKNGFEVINSHVAHSGIETEKSPHTIILATVQGDIHDIGKNIVKMLLSNYGYKVIDLGKDVSPKLIVEAIEKYNVSLIGLSALMTTTVKNMKQTIKYIKKSHPECAFVIGGAVLNEEYRDFVGADYYARDAMDGVNIANRFFGKES